MAGLLVLSMSACDNKCNVDCFTPPGELALKITDANDGTDLIYTGVYNADSITIYYFGDNSSSLPRYIIFEVQTDSARQSSFIISSDISWKSVEGFKDFYLYLNHLETDTLFYDVVSNFENCCTYHPLMSFSINGNDVEYDNSDYTYDFKK
jgi:hypothetical protein